MTSTVRDCVTTKQRLMIISCPDRFLGSLMQRESITGWWQPPFDCILTNFWWQVNTSNANPKIRAIGRDGLAARSIPV